MTMTTHPIQPLVIDNQGVIRFKENAIVRYLLDNGGIDMNKIAVKGFAQEDMEQFAQLIGYSVSGFGDLDYATDETIGAAEKMHEYGMSVEEARQTVTSELLSMLRRKLREPMAELFCVHPDDLKG